MPKPQLQSNIVVEVNTDKSNIESGQMSSRMPVHFIDPKGHLVKGYFTENNVNLTHTDRFTAAVGRMRKKNEGKYTEFLNAVSGMDPRVIYNELIRYRSSRNLSHLNPDKNFYDPEDVIERWGNAAGKNKNAMMAIVRNAMRDGFFEKELYELSKDIINDVKTVETVKLYGQSEHYNVNRRNNAMSELAEMLGCGELIAKSCNMTLISENKLMHGTFMLNAEGYDLKQLNPYTHPELMGKRTRSGNPVPRKMTVSESCLKKIADLQVVDYLCGNVDRHGGNFFYQFDLSRPDEMILTGIQGIDNDLSFVDTKLAKSTKSMTDMLKFRKISDDMADSVLMLNPEAFEKVMRNAGIKEAEISGALERFQLLKTGIQSGSVRRIPEGQWSSYINNLEFGDTFGEVTITCREWNDQVRKYDLDQMKKEMPDRFRAPKAVEAGMSQSEFDKFNLLENADRLSEIQRDLDINTTKGHRNGKDYKSMSAALNKVRELSEEMASKLDGANDKNYNLLSEAYRDLGKKAQKYLDSHTGNKKGMGLFRVEKAKELKTLSETMRHAALENSISAFNEQMKAEAQFIANGGKEAAETRMDIMMNNQIKAMRKYQEESLINPDPGKLQKYFSRVLTVEYSRQKIKETTKLTAKTANFYTNTDVMKRIAAGIDKSEEYRKWAEGKTSEDYEALLNNPEQLSKTAKKLYDKMGIGKTKLPDMTVRQPARRAESLAEGNEIKTENPKAPKSIM